MKKILIYLKLFAIEEGVVLHNRPGNRVSNLQPNSLGTKWLFKIKSDWLVPNESFNVAAAGRVMIKKLTKDEDDGSFHDIDETIVTDKLINLRVRGFEVKRVYSSKGFKEIGVAAVDLEY